MYSTTKEENLFDVFLDEYKDVNPQESLYIDDRRHILEKANVYGFNLLLMDRKSIYAESQFKIINSMDGIKEALKCE